MSEAALLDRSMTVATFLDWDDGTDTRYELVDGCPVAMAPPIGRHALISANCFRALDRQVRPSCRLLFGAGVARAPTVRQFRVPELLVSCEPLPERYVENMRVALEVLSHSTEKDDRSIKLDFYRSLESCEAIVLLWQDGRRAELHTRVPEGWLVRDFLGQGTMRFSALDLELSVDDAYPEEDAPDAQP